MPQRKVLTKWLFSRAPCLATHLGKLVLGLFPKDGREADRMLPGWGPVATFIDPSIEVMIR